ncbi:hypothetical protein ABVB69_32210 [Streptomyces sp. NPDC000349]|uniref:hypothetical protein n=1 Tax=unclassified Streptomyces TaxID=2593676 RepID=UPI002782E8E9|nr:hypothetical protein [Streptomyces sp. DSM 40167]MDQ0405935.1 hypothetical protein [Streptomyces sp. DSM 40167]
MADKQDKWLDRETAELLLRGESPDAVRPTDRERAERLALALGALSTPPPPTADELPGEAAALAAFRKAYAERTDLSAGAPGALATGTATRPSDAGLVRIGPPGDGPRRPGWSRPLRLGLVAALTVGMIGGVAVAAGTGVLFDRTQPEPGASASAAVSPDRPLLSPSPMDGAQGGAVPDGTPSGTPGTDSPGDGGTAANRSPERRDSDDRGTAGADARRSGHVAVCRKVRAGKDVDGAHRRALKEAAGGSSRVGKYCKHLLAVTGADGRDGGLRTGGGDGDDRTDRRDKNDRTEKDGKDDRGDEDGKGKGKEKGGKKGDDAKDEDDDDRRAAPTGPDAVRPQRHASSAFRPLTCAFTGDRESCPTGVTLSATRAQ